ncbi:Retrovirus-related Pol polyprotein from transposon TNT 1-94 [Eumeta japonica]|uniref:Retrovirus-related Pol polyprotein from transposon TNT 1-94 n=1 Tax=Eumeta variegata TaxID=151549 RepID=A0A4C1SIC4_EUMVA|nr:Retrovirus-related Pol polyprotein from transposon TNT 1-94 [Eumeta japonica]
MLTGRDLRDRKSTTGYCFMYSNCLISWCSKKQSTVSLSSAESEYVAMSMAGSEACWIANVLCDFNLSSLDGLQTAFDDEAPCKMTIYNFKQNSSVVVSILVTNLVTSPVHRCEQQKYQSCA